MSGRQFVKHTGNIVCVFVTALAFSACQPPPVKIAKPALMSSNGGNKTISSNERLAEGQSSETSPQQIEKVIEWNTASSSSIMPPSEIREIINEKCKKIGYERGVIVSVSLFESKVIADFDCRGENAT
tara:strand:- start:67 stop:450 length:384 start_codon:yes stop_codon:yes gene_type:complete